MAFSPTASPDFPTDPGRPDPAMETRPDGLVAALRAVAREAGFARLGIAPAVPPPHHAAFRDWLAAGRAGAMHAWLERHEMLRRHPTGLLSGVRSVIVLAADHAIDDLRPPGMSRAEEGRGLVARYARGDDYHDLLRSRANLVCEWLANRSPGCRARAVVDSAPLAERDFGLLAGLGWIGKNTMLIDPRAGSYFFLAAILTDLELPVDATIETDHCGSCTACLDACPTAALVQPRVLDANRCISALTIEDHGPVPEPLRTGMGAWIFGCDICQEVCPWNRHAPGSAEAALQPQGRADRPDLAELLALDDQAFRERFRGSPLVRAKRRGLLRSAAIALGNHPDPRAFAALSAALGDTEPVVRGAAAWALGRWIRAGVMAAGCLAALAGRETVEADETVRHELTAALAPPPHEASPSTVSSISPAGSRPGPSTA